MSLIDEIKESFANYRDDNKLAKGPLIMVPDDEDDLAPGFQAMRAYYGDQLIVAARRGYHHFAGSTMPTQGEELVLRTAPVMGPAMVKLLLRAFADGVLISQKQDYQVLISWHFHIVDALFADETFRNTSNTMATGFAADASINEFFTEYVQACLVGLAHATGFAHGEVNPNKVWDLWLLAGNSVVTTSYLAGSRLGSVWRERDVLDGIEIATEDSHGPDGED
jgi:hypothetical protein